MLFFVALIPIALIFTVQVTTNYIALNNYISVDKVSFADEYLTITKPDENDIVLNYPARVSPVGATNKNVVYSSSNPAIATVSSEGVITFKDFGEVIITVRSALTDSVKDTVTFLVTDDKAHRINITNVDDRLNLIKGDEYYLATEIIPKEALDKNVTFSSSDESVVAVALDGRITAIDGGEAEITAHTVNGKTDSIWVTVTAPVKGLSMSATSNITTAVNTVQFPSLTITPSNATNKSITYSSSDASVGEITSDGHISLLKAGVVTFTATTVDGNYSVDYIINYTGGYVTSSTMSEKYLDKIISVDFEYGKILDIPVTIAPSDYNLSHINNTYWESDNQNVVKIEDEKLIVVGGGSAVITFVAKLSETQEIRSKTTINVLRPAYAITINDDNGVGKYTYNMPSFTGEIAYSVLTEDSTTDCTDELTITCTNCEAKLNNGKCHIQFTGGTARIVFTAGNISREVEIVYTGSAQSCTVTDNVTLELGEYEFLYDDGLVPTSYSDYDSNILQISNGIVTAVKGGSTTITANFDDSESKQFNITVLRAGQDIYIGGEPISNTTIKTSLKTWKLNASVYPVDATEKVIDFSSSNNSVATVTAGGLVEFISEGSVTITMSVKKHPNVDDCITKTITITSTFGYPDTFKLTDYSDVVIANKGLTHKIYISNSFTPSDYTFDPNQLSFVSANQSVAIVSKGSDESGVYGLITGVDGGTTTISAIIGNIQKTVNVTVNVLSTAVSIDYFDGESYVGLPLNSAITTTSSVQLSPNITPKNTTNKQVSWSIVKGSEYASVSSSGAVNFTGYGTITVRLTMSDTGIYYDGNISRIVPEIAVYETTTDITNSSISVGVSSANPKYRVKLTVDNSYTIIDSLDYSSIECAITNDDSANDGKITSTSDGNGLFTISRPSTLSISIKSTITFRCYGKSASINVKFLSFDSAKMVYVVNGKNIVLDNTLDVNYGYEQKLVFGSTSYDWQSEGDATKLHVGIVRYTAVLSHDVQDKMFWSITTGSNFAELPDPTAGNIYFNQDTMPSMENILTLRIHDEPDYNLSTIRCSYDMTVIRKSINVFDQDSFVFARGAEVGWAFVLQSNLGTDEDNDPTKPFSALNGGSAVETLQNIYGNGYTLNVHNLSNNNFTLYGNIRNIIVKGCNNDSSKESFEKSILFHVNTAVSYSKFSNALKTGYCGPYAGLFTFYKCLFTNAAQCGLQMGRGENSTDGDQTVLLEDCIFDDVGQCAVDYQCGNVQVKGRLDVYNFRTSDDYDLTYRSAIKNAFNSDEFKLYVDKTGSSTVANVGIVSFRNILKNKDPKSDVTFYNGSEYVESDGTTGHNYKMVKGTTGTLIKTHMTNMWLAEIYDSNGNILPDAITQTSQVDYSILYRIGIN